MELTDVVLPLIGTLGLGCHVKSGGRTPVVVSPVLLKRVRIQVLAQGF